MQVKKDNIRELVLKSAYDEFISNGYKGTSMRVIAQKSGVGLSNIYNYFKNKDDIFLEILNPLLTELNNQLDNHNVESNISIDIFVMESFQKEMVDEYLSIIKRYKNELNLLLFNASGSVLENYQEEFTEKQILTGYAYLKKMKEKYDYINTDVSEMFIRTISSWFLTLLGKITLFENISDEELEKFILDYIKFSSGGWKSIMRI